jgi:hypothetical protein
MVYAPVRTRKGNHSFCIGYKSLFWRANAWMSATVRWEEWRSSASAIWPADVGNIWDPAPCYLFLQLHVVLLCWGRQKAFYTEKNVEENIYILKVRTSWMFLRQADKHTKRFYSWNNSFCCEINKTLVRIPALTIFLHASWHPHAQRMRSLAKRARVTLRQQS